MALTLRITLVLLFTCAIQGIGLSQDMMPLIKKVQARLETVRDYQAEGQMKTDVSFIKAPVGKVTIFYKQPNKFRLKKDGGLSILPKGGLTVNMSTILSEKDFMALYAGKTMVGSFMTTIVKLIPTTETSDVVMSTLYIDETDHVIRKAITTTKENGTYELEMSYGSHLRYGLPAKLTFSFNTKDYKLPKGITLEFGEDERPKKDLPKDKKGRIEITYTSYIINKGIPDSVFRD